MAVITQYVVVRDGVEKMTFTSKKEADAYDKMLDIADSLIPFIEQAECGLDEATIEKLAFYFATRKDDLSSLLKGNATEKAAEPVKKAAKKAEPQ
ncbi:YebG family protein [Shewanella sp. JM162201]|uniref:YebG family protein n=1 Tax=Shewanella jiangmenensis TaxID=2837387 RepID=A0ABS5V5D2_9GAMM|nr:YebG family protein [Shewanella jiangmenensis]MBT1445671.1 YebG family protein [Shewanella jiangmenensis]